MQVSCRVANGGKQQVLVTAVVGRFLLTTRVNCRWWCPDRRVGMNAGRRHLGLNEGTVVHDLPEVLGRHVDAAGTDDAHAIGGGELIPGQLEAAPRAGGRRLEPVLDPFGAAAAGHLYVSFGVQHGPSST